MSKTKTENWIEGKFPLIKTILSNILESGTGGDYRGFLNGDVRRNFDEITYTLIKAIYLRANTTLKYAQMVGEIDRLEAELKETTEIILKLQRNLNKELTDTQGRFSETELNYHNSIADTIHRLSKSRDSTERSLNALNSRIDTLFINPTELQNSTFDLIHCFLASHGAALIVAEIKDKVHGDSAEQASAYAMGQVLQDLANQEYQDIYYTQDANPLNRIRVGQEKDRRWTQKMAVLVMNLLMCYKEIGLSIPTLNDPLANAEFLSVLDKFGIRNRVEAELNNLKDTGNIYGYINQGTQIASMLANMAQTAADAIRATGDLEAVTVQIEQRSAEIAASASSPPPSEAPESDLKQQFRKKLRSIATINELWEYQRQHPDNSKFSRAE